MVDEIKENKAVTSAKIIGSRKDYRNWAFSLNYTYKIDSNLYVRKSSHTVSGKYLKDYMYKYFPVFSKTNKKSYLNQLDSLQYLTAFSSILQPQI